MDVPHETLKKVTLSHICWWCNFYCSGQRCGLCDRKIHFISASCGSWLSNGNSESERRDRDKAFCKSERTNLEILTSCQLSRPSWCWCVCKSIIIVNFLIEMAKPDCLFVKKKHWERFVLKEESYWVKVPEVMFFKDVWGTRHFSECESKLFLYSLRKKSAIFTFSFYFIWQC